MRHEQSLLDFNTNYLWFQWSVGQALKKRQEIMKYYSLKTKNIVPYLHNFTCITLLHCFNLEQFYQRCGITHYIKPKDTQLRTPQLMKINMFKCKQTLYNSLENSVANWCTQPSTSVLSCLCKCVQHSARRFHQLKCYICSVSVLAFCWAFGCVMFVCIYEICILHVSVLFFCRYFVQPHCFEPLKATLHNKEKRPILRRRRFS